MIFYILKVIIVSIIVSAFAYGLNLIPRFREWKQALLMQSLNSALLTAVLTIVFIFGIYPSWFITFILIGCSLLVSARLTESIFAGTAPKSGPSPDHN